MRMIILALLAILTPFPRVRGGAEERKFIVHILPNGADIAISGPFTQGLSAAFHASLDRAPKARLVRLVRLGSSGRESWTWQWTSIPRFERMG